MNLTDRFMEALSYSFDLNNNRFRKGTEAPYIAHLLAVAAIVLEHGGDEVQTIAALLHEAGEDSEGVRTLIEIRKRFGERVVKIVQACSDSIRNVGQQKADWRLRKSEYLASIKVKPADAILVCLADKIHNSRSVLSDLKMVGEAAWQRFDGDKEGTLWYYRALVEAFRPVSKGLLAQSMMVKELEETVNEIERLV